MSLTAWVDPHPAYKFFITDLNKIRLSNGVWEHDFGKEGFVRAFSNVQIQVEVVKLSGMNNEIMLVSDGTGKAKVTRGSNVPGQFTWLNIGSYCSVIGSLLSCGAIPHIQATKIARVHNPVQLQMWPLEVHELRNHLTGISAPSLLASTSTAC